MPIVLFFHYNLNTKPRSCSFLVYYDCLKCKVFKYEVVLCLNIQVCSKNKFENFVIFAAFIFGVGEMPRRGGRDAYRKINATNLYFTIYLCLVYVLFFILSIQK